MLITIMWGLFNLANVCDSLVCTYTVGVLWKCGCTGKNKSKITK